MAGQVGKLFIAFSPLALHCTAIEDDVPLRVHLLAAQITRVVILDILARPDELQFGPCGPLHEVSQ